MVSDVPQEEVEKILDDLEGRTAYVGPTGSGRTTIPRVKTEEELWEDWTDSVDIRLSNLSRGLIGVGAGLLVFGGLTLLNGRITLKLIRMQNEIVSTINEVGGSLMGGPNGAHTAGTSYVAPTGRVTTEPEPVDPELAQELRDKIEKSGGEVGPVL